MTTTATLDPQTRAALEQRTGRDLLAYVTGDVAGRETLAVKAARARLSLAKGGPAILTDVDVLKVGSFNYGAVVLDEIDLEAMVARFAQLRDSGVFSHVPIRLDHSWTILNVVGYVDDLRTREGIDPTTSESTTFLTADLRITEPDPVLGMIERGTIVNRSSEVGEYMTNAGRLYPLAYWGLAFVDIPAVEGLNGNLSRQLAELSRPHKIEALTADTPKGSTVPDEQTDDQQQTEGTEQPAEELEGAEQGTPGENGEPGGVDEPEGVETPDPAEVETGAGDDGEGGASGDAQGDQQPPAVDSLAAAERAELEQLRAERAAATVALMRERGLVLRTTDDTAVAAMLSRMAPADRTLLEELARNVAAPRALGRTPGALTSSRPGGGAAVAGAGSDSDEFVRALSADTEPDEVGALWANLTTEQRKPGTPQHAAYLSWRREHYGE